MRAIVGETVTLPCAVDGLPSKDKNSVQWLKGSTAKGYFALGFPPLGIERFTQKAGDNKGKLIHFLQFKTLTPLKLSGSEGAT